MTPEDERFVRAVIREEIVHAFQALGREADRLDMPYETAELDSRALENIKAAAEGTVKRLTCTHEKRFAWGGDSRCASCGEPEELPADPFAGPGHEHVHDISEGEPTDCIECGAPYKEEG